MSVSSFIRRKAVLVAILIVAKIRSKIYKNCLSTNTVKGCGNKFIQAPQFGGEGTLMLTGVQLGVWPSPGLLNGVAYLEARSREARVEICCNTVINNNCTIIADKTFITIGSGCLIGGNFFVCDSDFHGLDIEHRRSGYYSCAGVTIGDDVFIGEGVKILKGVKVGNGAVIGSGSVVVKDVEPLAIYAGVPARKIRSLRDVQYEK